MLACQFFFSSGYLFFYCFSFLSFYFFLAVEQKYETRVSDEFVIIGNDVLLKCSVPSFALDFIILNGWVTNEGVEILANSKDGKLLLMRDGEMMAFNFSVL